MRGDEYRRLSRDLWARAAPGWEARRDDVFKRTIAVSQMMIDALSPQPGQTILELAAGTGDTGFMAARRIVPDGTLITSDFVPEMVQAAKRRAAELEIDNIDFKQIDGEAIDLPADSVDGVLCRWGYTLMPDPDKALRETHRVLKPGSRVVLAAWSERENNPWSAIRAEALIRRELMPAPKPGDPGPFVWAQPELITQILEHAGFTDPTVNEVIFQMRYSSFEQWLKTTRDMSRQFADILEDLNDKDKAQLEGELREQTESFQKPDGNIVFPASSWVASASTPS